MCRDELIIKLRAEFNNHIRPIKINSQCEFCGSCDDLHLHHIDTFSNLLDETLEDLKINIYSENFTDSEVENINNIMLGKQLRSRFATLCKNCHKEVHKDGYIKARDRLKPKTPKIISAEEIKILEKYLKDSYEEGFLFTKEVFRETIDKIINNDSKLLDIMNELDGKHKRDKGQRLYNKLFMKLGFNYRVFSKPKEEKINGKRVKKTYWIIGLEEK